MEPLAVEQFVDFGDVPEEINNLLQQGVVAYRRDAFAADRLFRQALTLAPHELSVYFCLYKIHTYQGNLDQAFAIAESGFQEASRQAGLSTDYRNWRTPPVSPEGAERFALYTLKALAFIHLRRRERDQASQILAELARLDPGGTVGWRVIEDLERGLGTC